MAVVYLHFGRDFNVFDMLNFYVHSVKTVFFLEIICLEYREP